MSVQFKQDVEEEHALLGTAKSTHYSENFGGDKKISFIGGLSLLINNITGPGLLTIPIIFQQAGWLTPLIVMIVIMVTSSFAATLLCEAMARMPQNHNYEERIEFTGLAKILFPKWAFVGTMILLNVSLLAMLISSIVVSAQTMDLAVDAVAKHSWAIEFYPNPGFVSIHQPSKELSPFGDAYVLSLGYVITLIATVPLGYFNLDDNIIIQNGALLVLILIFIEWFVAFFMKGLDCGNVSVFKTNQSQVLGTIVFNYAFVITVPSWVNEKKRSVSVNKSVWSATIISTVFYFIIGYFGACAYSFGPNQDLLNVIEEDAHFKILHIVSEIGVYLFPVVALMTGIPVFSIIIRYNLVENKICGKAVANFWAIIFPWLLSVVFYTGGGFLDIVNWTSLFVNGVINFIIPIILYIFAIKNKHIPYFEKQNIPDDEQPPSFYALPKKWNSLLSSVVIVTIIGGSTIVAIILAIIQAFKK